MRGFWQLELLLLLLPTSWEVCKMLSNTCVSGHGCKYHAVQAASIHTQKYVLCVVRQKRLRWGMQIEGRDCYEYVGLCLAGSASLGGYDKDYRGYYSVIVVQLPYFFT
ncbi:uncharacterized protein F4812DRAFT_413951 [Daldinia caldariorum]|uniref:uncharacterized protein n=1 Tax=Daldinia caldariorum TaxID=326644 RepID=UPI002007AE88|nr:uncharacterized protein F4812DRAFT_413951 [Daldinia caldariorum]KAI1471406.1 hypothetical protein F4812DRAFT_413951 [Daldinia caldariorum]